jgi:hypothetical protein
MKSVRISSGLDWMEFRIIIWNDISRLPGWLLNGGDHRRSWDIPRDGELEAEQGFKHGANGGKKGCSQEQRQLWVLWGVLFRDLVVSILFPCVPVLLGEGLPPAHPVSRCKSARPASQSNGCLSTKRHPNWVSKSQFQISGQYLDYDNKCHFSEFNLILVTLIGLPVNHIVRLPWQPSDPQPFLWGQHGRQRK